jgi:hypothetical protein
MPRMTTDQARELLARGTRTGKLASTKVLGEDRVAD